MNHQQNNNVSAGFVWGCLLCVSLMVSACGDAKESAAIGVNCQPATGSAFEGGQVEICKYATDSLEKAYNTIVASHSAEQGSAYTMLKKTLPTKNTKDHFDAQEVWIDYTWLSPESLRITLQMAGGEDELLLTRQGGNVQVKTTLSAD